MLLEITTIALHTFNKGVKVWNNNCESLVTYFASSIVYWMVGGGTSGRVDCDSHGYPECDWTKISTWLHILHHW